MIFHSEIITGRKTNFLPKLIIGNVDIISSFRSHYEHLEQFVNVTIRTHHFARNAKSRDCQDSLNLYICITFKETGVYNMMLTFICTRYE